MNTVPVKEAITAIMLCGEELLMVCRQVHLSSFSGFMAFPGGKVDPNEVLPTFLQTPNVDARLIAAMIREVIEELGVDLDRLAEAGLVQSSSYLGEATTPLGSNQRFRTHFVRIDLATKPPLTIDLGEISSAEWASPAEWQKRYQKGNLLLAPPTLAVVDALVQHPDPQNTPILNPQDYLPDRLRSIFPLAGLRQIWVPSNTLPPAQHTNAYVIGDQYKVLVDPSPANRKELARLLTHLDEIGIDEILITHHHPDHRQFANEIAAHYDIPLSLSDDTRKRISALDKTYFGDLLLRTYVEGDVVTRWLGQAVRVMMVPGHDEGQIALMPDNRAWCLVGDLIQGIGTVVIAAPEGHMGRYFASLEKVIALQPKVVLPSHGNALGGTYRLQETLNHRRQREQTILALLQAEKSEAEMLQHIYPDLNPLLQRLAAATIRAHLQKLSEEGHAAATSMLG